MRLFSLGTSGQELYIWEFLFPPPHCVRSTSQFRPYFHVHFSIWSHNQPVKRAGWTDQSHFADEETEAQDGESTCPKSPRNSIKKQKETWSLLLPAPWLRPPAARAAIPGRLRQSGGGRSPRRGKPGAERPPHCSTCPAPTR